METDVEYPILGWSLCGFKRVGHPGAVLIWWSSNPPSPPLEPESSCGWGVRISQMNKFVLPTSTKVLPTVQTFCPVGIQIAQTVVHFAHFQVQARKRGVLGWALGCFVYVHIPQRDWVKNKGWGWYCGLNETPYGQIETHLGYLYEKWEKVL